MLIVGAYRQQVDDRFADSEIFAFLGPMHIEQAGLSAHGLLIKGTGLDSIIESSALTTIGLVTALCDANSIKKARYTIQVVSCTFYKLLRKAFEESSYSEDEFDEWLRHMKKNTSFKYWYNVLRLEKNILLLVRSLRQSNFLLFISTLQHLAPVFIYSRSHPLLAVDVSFYTRPSVSPREKSGTVSAIHERVIYCKQNRRSLQWDGI